MLLRTGSAQNSKPGTRNLQLSFRHRVVSATTPWMTAANALQREPAAGNGAVKLNRLQPVLGATRRIAASRGRSEQSGLDRRQRAAIHLHREHQDVLRRVHSDTFSNLARRMAARKSRSTSGSFIPTIDDRATRTTRTGSRKSCWCSRKVSRNKRRARLRTTAGPSLRPVTTPSRDWQPGARGVQLAIKQPLTRRCPCCRISAKSRCCFSRMARGNRSEGRSAAIEIRRG